MKLVPKGTSFVASGTVYAKVVLPQGMKVGLEINRVLPDVLVFDGEVPLLSVDPTFSEAGGEKDGDSVPPLPDPLPERAFARIRPEEWLDADSEADETIGDEGSVYTVTADIIEVPLQVLPGRQKDFSNFVSKVSFYDPIFGGVVDRRTHSSGCVWDARCRSRDSGHCCSGDRCAGIAD